VGSAAAVKNSKKLAAWNELRALSMQKVSEMRAAAATTKTELKSVGRTMTEPCKAGQCNICIYSRIDYASSGCKKFISKVEASNVDSICRCICHEMNLPGDELKGYIMEAARHEVLGFRRGKRGSYRALA
jgi:hypothetical protein